MTTTARYFGNFFPTFLLGAVFGKVMDNTGSAVSISTVIILKLGKPNLPEYAKAS